MIARMDADDVALADRLERQLAVLDARPDVALLGGGIVLVDEQGREFDRERAPSTPSLVDRNDLVHGTVVMRTDAFRALGGYRLDQSEDYDLWLRFQERHGVAAVEEPVVRYRFHPGQFSVTRLERQALGSLCVRAAAARAPCRPTRTRSRGSSDSTRVSPSGWACRGRRSTAWSSPTRCTGRRR